MKIRFNDLRNFLEVAGSKTMSDAAQNLGITQPALSESIKRLESDVGEVLFYRSRAGVALTPSGQMVLAKVQSAWSNLLEVQSISNPLSQVGARLIRIGCHPVVASYSLPVALQKLEKATPHYKFQFRHESSRGIQREIQLGHIDIGIVINPTPSPDLVIRKIALDEFTVWRAKKSRSDRVFCNLDLIQTQFILRKWRSSPSDRVNTDSLELIVRLAQSQLGLGILPARAVRLLNSPLVRVESAPVYKDEIAVVFRPEFGRSVIARPIIDSLTKCLSE